VDPESKKLLEEAVELSKQNNEMLKEMRRHMRFSRFVSIMYWVFIVGSTVGAFYLIQPYVDQFRSSYDGVSDMLENLGQ